MHYEKIHAEHGLNMILGCCSKVMDGENDDDASSWSSAPPDPYHNSDDALLINFEVNYFQVNLKCVHLSRAKANTMQ